MATVYIKKEIKSLEDLPKEGRYLTHIKYTGNFEDDTPMDELHKTQWMVYVDWYLQPVELPDEEEIHKKAYNACMTPSMPNGEPEPEHTYHDAFVDGVNWLLTRLK